MLPLLRTPKWIALTVLLVVALTAFGGLSWWQWQRAQRDQVVREAIPATRVLTTGTPLAVTAYGQPVSATGRYDAAHQVLVTRGSTLWVVTPLLVSSGSAIPVARASVRSAGDPAVHDVTSGAVTVVGIAQPFDGDPGTPSSLPPGQADRLTAASLALPYPVVGGWVAATTQTPAAAIPAAEVVPPYGPAISAPLRLQNLSYALQWLAFAGFAGWLWWRMLRDDHADRLERDDATAETAPSTRGAPVREVY